MFELEGVINSRDCCFKFFNRSMPIFPEKNVILKPSEQKLIKVKAPFVDEISGMAIVKILNGVTHSTLLIFRLEEMIGIIDLRSLGYYKIKQGILQQNVSRYYRFEGAKKLCDYFNTFVNTLKKEREQELPEDKYPWLDPDDECRHMTDREILDKYINYDNSCLQEEEKREVMDMFNYKEAFSLTEVEIDVTDKSPFFIRPYQIREEDKAFTDKEMK